MKKVLLSSVVVAGLFLAGCSSKTPEVGPNADLLMKVQNSVGVVYFDYDKFNIKSDMASVIMNNAKLLNQDGAKNFKVKVEGNCDEWGTGEYNDALGQKRADAVKKALVKGGVSADRIETVTYGKTNPVCMEKTQACDAKNRRAELKLSK